MKSVSEWPMYGAMLGTLPVMLCKYYYRIRSFDKNRLNLLTFHSIK